MNIILKLKEQANDTYYNMDAPWTPLAIVRDYILYDSICMKIPKRQFIEIVDLVVAWGLELEKQLTTNGYKPFWEWWKLDCGYDSITL